MTGPTPPPTRTPPALARAADGRRATFRTGETIYRPGDAPRGWIAVEAGSVRVRLVGASGREATLYRIAPGDACVLTTSAILGDGSLAAEALAETDVVAWISPLAAFRRALDGSAGFRDAVLRNYAERVAELISALDAALFVPLDARLAELILARARDGAVDATHHELAGELGTAREVAGAEQFGAARHAHRVGTAFGSRRRFVVAEERRSGETGLDDQVG
ncbi:MAG: Crp/Fnr family transcriptional regulator, partial [Hyphomicrobiales bacterium]|nr:Crp/Fnr family transcriptional regulator [Hyphomicrobiales bacterium]